MNTLKLRKRLLQRQAFGNAIKARREALQLTQLQLAHRIGYAGPMAGSKISRIEGGVSEPRLDVLNRIAVALDTPVSKLIETK